MTLSFFLFFFFKPQKYLFSVQQTKQTIYIYKWRKSHSERLLVSTRVAFNVTLNVPDVVGMSKMGGDLHVSLYP